MASIRSYTTIEQSKRLAEILPIESADMYYRDWKRATKDIRIAHVGTAHKKDLPCWSLAALLKIIPYPELREQYNGNWTCRVSNANTTFLWEDDNPIDACYEIIIKLHKEGLL